MTDLKERGEIQQAQQYLEVALRNGSPFEAFHLLSSIHASTSRLPLNAGGRPGLCGVSVAWYKLVSEKGAWDQDFLGEAEKAWQRGEEGNAMVGWWIAGEMGMEIGQNNLGWLLEKGIGLDLLLPSEDDEDIAIELDEKANQAALMHWVRSAAQDNVDAMVKVGDYYCECIVSGRLLAVRQPSQLQAVLSILPLAHLGGTRLRMPGHVVKLALIKQIKASPHYCPPRSLPRRPTPKRNPKVNQAPNPKLTTRALRPLRPLPIHSPKQWLITKRLQITKRHPWRIGILDGCTRMAWGSSAIGGWRNGIMTSRGRWAMGGWGWG